MTHVTRRLIAKNGDQLRNPTLVEYGLPLPFLLDSVDNKYYSGELQRLLPNPNALVAVSKGMRAVA